MSRLHRLAAWAFGLALLATPPSAAMGQERPPQPFAPTWANLAGASVFASKGCGRCHAIRGFGATAGPHRRAEPPASVDVGVVLRVGEADGPAGFVDDGSPVVNGLHVTSASTPITRCTPFDWLLARLSWSSPASGNSSQNSNATAKPFPDVTNELIRAGTALRYRFAKSWYLSLAYLFEQFNQTNFRTNN